MMSDFAMSGVPQGPLHIAPGFQLRWDGPSQAHVLLHPEGSIPLTPNQAQILERCKGTLTAEDIAREMQQTAAMNPSEVREFLAVAYVNNWIHGQ